MSKKLLLTFSVILFCTNLYAKPEFGESFGDWKLCYSDFSKKDTETCKKLSHDKNQKINFDKVECETNSDGYGGIIESGAEKGVQFFTRSIYCSFKGIDMNGYISTICNYGGEGNNTLILTRKSNKERYSLTLHCKSYK